MYIGEYLSLQLRFQYLARNLVKRIRGENLYIIHILFTIL